MVGEIADVDPLPPHLAGLPHLVGGFLVRLWCGMPGPRQCDEDVVALGEPGAGAGLVALEAQSQIGGQPQRRVCVGVAAGPRDRLAVRRTGVLPLGRDAVVVERRLAAHHQFDRAADAAHRAQQDVFGVPVHRRTPVRARAPLQVVPGALHQRLADDEPAGVGLPGGLQDQAAGQVPACRGHRDAVGASRKCPAPRSRIAPNTLGSPAAAHRAIRSTRPRTPGRCSRSRTGSRSRRWAETDCATRPPVRTAPAPSP